MIDCTSVYKENHPAMICIEAMTARDQALNLRHT